MTLTQLTYAVAVADHKTFAEAAAACFVTQPTLSMQLLKLEEELGASLFDRSAHPARPTAIGARVIAQARIALNEAKRVAELASADSADVSGELRLSAIPTLAPYLLPLFLPGLVERYPKLNVSVEELQTQQIIDGLRSGDLDVGILATPLRDGAIVETPLFNEPFLVYASPRHPLAALKRVREQDLAVKDAWLLDEGHCFRDQAMRLCGERKRGASLTPNLRFASGNLETLKKFVDRGPGYTFLPWLAAAELPTEAKRKQLKRFTAPVPSREISLVHGRYYRRRAVLDALRDEILAALPKELKAMRPDEQRLLATPAFD